MADGRELIATALRWRSIPQRYTFVDALASNAGEEWQLCFAVAELAASDLMEGTVIRFLAQEEPQRTRRGLRAFQCSKLLERSAGASPLLCTPCDPPPPLHAATQQTGGDPSSALVPLCKHWVRGGCSTATCTFRHSFANEHEERIVSESRLRWAAQRRAHEDADDPYLSGGEGGGKSAHGQRHAEFVAWLLQTFGAEVLSGGAGVLDVAGGGGDLAFELHCRNGVRTTLLEPREVRLDSRQRKWLRKQGEGGLGAYHHLRDLLDERFEESNEGRRLLRDASCVIGLHSDEATELIVDAALKYGRPFAVVPCCVFPRLFPQRRLAGGGAVRTTAELCAYLLEKTPDLETDFLPLTGRNKIIFRRTAALPQPERTLAAAAAAYVPQSVARSKEKFAGARTEASSSPRCQEPDVPMQPQPTQGNSLTVAVHTVLAHL